MTKYTQNTLYRASRLLGEAFDLDDPMNNFGPESIDVPTTDLAGATDDSPVESDETEQTYDVDVANPVCPCCGVRLNIVDSAESSEADDLGVEVMDPTLEPQGSDSGNEDAYVTLDSLSFGDDEEEDDETSEEDPEQEDDEEEEYGEKVEAF